MLFSDKQLFAVGAVAIVGVIYLARQGSEVVTDATNAVNPLNQDNIFSRGADNLTEFLFDPLGETPETVEFGEAIYRGVGRIRSLWE